MRCSTHDRIGASDLQDQADQEKDQAAKATGPFGFTATA
jgi:hypothetical protein